MGLNIATVTSCYNDYWDLFGAQWLATVAACDPQPVQVILVTDAPRDAPDWVTQISCEDRHMGMMLNEGVKHVTTEWVHHHGIDDLLAEDAYTDVETAADVISFPHLYGGGMSGLAQYQGGFETMWQMRNNPMLGGFFHRTQVLRDIPYRRYGWCDEAHFCEMSYFHKSLHVTDRPRSIWIRHPRAHSISSNAAYQDEVNAFKGRLAAGLIQMGVPE